MAAVAVTAGLAACTSHLAKPATPQSICRARFADMLDAQADTVQGVTEVGPRPISAPPGHLGTYAGSTPVTLCLVGKSADDVDNAIAITPDGKTYSLESARIDPPEQADLTVPVSGCLDQPRLGGRSGCCHRQDRADGGVSARLTYGAPAIDPDADRMTAHIFRKPVTELAAAPRIDQIADPFHRLPQRF
jgi:hypothetical protein